MTGTSPSDCLVSYPGHSLGGILPQGREAVCLFYSPNWLGKGNGWMFVLSSPWKNSVNTVIGVGMLIDPQALKSLNSIKKIQPRMMVATFNGNSSKTIISCDSPTNPSDEMDLDTFNKKLSSLVYSPMF